MSSEMDFRRRKQNRKGASPTMEKETIPILTPEEAAEKIAGKKVALWSAFRLSLSLDNCRSNSWTSREILSKIPSVCRGGRGFRSLVSVEGRSKDDRRMIHLTTHNNKSLKNITILTTALSTHTHCLSL